MRLHRWKNLGGALHALEDEAHVVLLVKIFENRIKDKGRAMTFCLLVSFLMINGDILATSLKKCNPAKHSLRRACF